MPIKYSVVVATYNRATILRECLEALAVQTVPTEEYELILINDGSDDNSNSVVNEFRKSHARLNFAYIEQKNAGPAKARNVGIKLAKGEIVYFTDDDCVVPRDWIKTLAAQYAKYPEIAGAGGWYKYPKNSNDSWIKKTYISYTSAILRISYGNKIDYGEIKNNIFLKNPSGNTSNMSYKKWVLLKVGGFAEDIDFVGLVDWELKKRIMDFGYCLLYFSYPVVHLKPLGLNDIIQKFFNRGRGHFNLIKKNPELFEVYYPNARNAERLISASSDKSFLFIFCVYFDLTLRKIGWQYQKFISMAKGEVMDKTKIRFSKKWKIRGIIGMKNIQIIEKKILRIHYQAGSASPRFARENNMPIGGAQFYAYLEGRHLEKALLRYKIKFPEDFDFVKGGKLPGIFGGMQKSRWSSGTPNGFDGFSIRLMWRENGNGEIYAYLPSSKNYGTSFCSNWQFKRNFWHLIEQEIVLNKPYFHNGIINLKIDGETIISKKNILFRNSDNLKIEGLFFSTFFGEHDITWVTPQKTYVDFGDFSYNGKLLELS